MNPFSITTLLALEERFGMTLSVNVYIVQRSDQAILIDAGFANDENIQLIMNEVIRKKLNLQAIYLTHHHIDHSLGAPILATLQQCPIYCHEKAYDQLVATWRKEGFDPSQLSINKLTKEDIIRFQDQTIHVIETPGHAHGHVSYYLEEADCLFSGDMVIAGSSVWVGPPDGHLEEYLNSLKKLIELDPSLIYGGHGPVIEHPRKYMEDLYDRRILRDQQILTLLQDKAMTVEEIATNLYQQKGEHWVVRRNILGHLQRLEKQKRIYSKQDPHLHKLFYMIANNQSL